jgi:hypothetical protein
MESPYGLTMVRILACSHGWMVGRVFGTSNRTESPLVIISTPGAKTQYRRSVNASTLRI